MSDKYSKHKIIYDIIDQSCLLKSEMARLSRFIDVDSEIPNSLQSILGKIYRYEGYTQSEIAKIYNIDQKNTIKYVSELEKRGYIFKKEENHIKKLYLTKKGREINEHFMYARGEFLDKVIDYISYDDMTKTRETLLKLTKILIEHNNYLEKL